jgi:hypothetical protein
MIPPKALPERPRLIFDALDVVDKPVLDAAFAVIKTG